MTKKRIILAGGSGFIGGLLARHFQERAWEIVVLSRSSRPGFTYWDGASAGPWMEALEGADLLMNLAGRSVNCRYHARNRRLMMDSRLAATRVLGEAVGHCRRPPAVWINASTATIYRHSLDQAMDETKGVIAATPEAKDAFSIEVATAWERTFEEARAPQTRKVALRSAMVLGGGQDSNNVYAVLRRLVRLGLGGRMGSGRQYVSWVHETDFCRAVEFILMHGDLAGSINVAAPNPLPNAEMMTTLRRELGIPLGLPAAKWMLEVGAWFLRTETELIIKSRRVVPARLLAAGFRFRYETFREAVRALEQGR